MLTARTDNEEHADDVEIAEIAIIIRSLLVLTMKSIFPNWNIYHELVLQLRLVELEVYKRKFRYDDDGTKENFQMYFDTLKSVRPAKT